MKQNQNIEEDDDMRKEYDFSSMKNGVRGKYAAEFKKTTITVLLDSDVAGLFPDSRSVNEALRTLARVLRDKDKKEL